MEMAPGMSDGCIKRALPMDLHKREHFYRFDDANAPYTYPSMLATKFDYGMITAQFVKGGDESLTYFLRRITDWHRKTYGEYTQEDVKRAMK